MGRLAIAFIISTGLILVTIFLLFLGLADAHEGSSTIAEWYRSLIQPGSKNISCCGGFDCHETDYRIVGDHYEAHLDAGWVAIPPSKILRNVPNPTGRAVLCWNRALGVLCFIRPSES